MIRLSFLYNREVMNFTVKDRVIRYKDRKWVGEIQCIPKDEQFIQKILRSRNKLPSFLISLFDLTSKEQEEYDGAKTDGELADIIIKDAAMKGCKLIRREDI